MTPETLDWLLYDLVWGDRRVLVTIHVSDFSENGFSLQAFSDAMLLFPLGGATLALWGHRALSCSPKP